MMDKLTSLLVKESHPLQVTITALGSSYSDRLITLRVCEREVSQVLSFLLLSDCTISTIPVDLTCALCKKKTKTVYVPNFSFWFALPGQFAYSYSLFINNSTLLTLFIIILFIFVHIIIYDSIFLILITDQL